MVQPLLQLLCLTAAGLSHATSAYPEPGKLPIVDLGYVRQQARRYNATGDFYTFSNIRYAEPPVGNLRWAAPVRPRGRSSQIVDGGNAKPSCPNAWPDWFAQSFLGVSQVPQNPADSEDCLFLDVTTPKSAFEQSQRLKAPVLVWVHGGGSTVGSKTGGASPTDPATLVSRAQKKAHQEGLVFVAFNYRLGIFGTLNGPAYQKQGGISNAGLLDQRLALDWVQENIGKFGGDRNRVTVMAESSGAASVLNHLTANGGKGKAPFQQAIIQSPTSGPALEPDVEDFIYGQFLETAGVKGLRGLRQLSRQALLDLNHQFISNSSFGTFGTAGIWSVDGTYVQGSINKLLQEGKFDKSVKVLTSFNTLEGSVFSQNVSATPDYDFRSYVSNYIFGISDSDLNHVVNSLYPPANPPHTIYTNEQERVWTFTGELLTYCYARTTNLAYRNATHTYLFPGLHTDDTPYVFYNGQGPSSTPHDGVANKRLALELQDIVTNFAVTSDPKGQSTLRFPPYGPRARVLEMTTGKMIHDPHASDRCEFLQSRF